MDKRLFFVAMPMLVLTGCNATVSPNAGLPMAGPGATIRQLGFTELALPTTAYGPGALVTSLAGSGGLSPPLRLSYLCRPDFANAPQPLIDQAASGTVATAFSGSFNLDVAALNRLSLGANIKDIESVSLTMQNVRIEQLPISDLATIVAQLGPVCRNTITNFRTRGLAYQTVQALRADIDYKVTFSANASAEAKATITQRLSASIGAAASNASDGIISGKNLYFGLALQEL